MKLWLLALIAFTASGGIDDSWLRWDSRHAREVAAAARVTGKVGGIFAARGLHTERSINYKLRATWLTPDVIRACARLEQLSALLTETQARELVNAAEAAGDTVIMVELDPNEGSGVIPSSWSANLSVVHPKTDAVAVSRGVSVPALRDVRALAGAARRDYNYDVFWMVFRLAGEGGEALFGPADKELELTVQVNGQTGRVRWPIPDSIRQKRREP